MQSCNAHAVCVGVCWLNPRLRLCDELKSDYAIISYIISVHYSIRRRSHLAGSGGRAAAWHWRWGGECGTAGGLGCRWSTQDSDTVQDPLRWA